MSCYKYWHWDPFMDVNLKYHQQGICLSLSASLLFEAAWKIQYSIIGFWCHPWQSFINDVTLNTSITLDVIEQCKYLTLAFYCASGINLSTDCQLIHVQRPVIAICSRVEQGGWLWGQMGWQYFSLSCLFLPVSMIRVSGAFKWRSRRTGKVFYSGRDSDASFTSLKKIVFEEGFSWERPNGAS